MNNDKEGGREDFQVDRRTDRAVESLTGTCRKERRRHPMLEDDSKDLLDQFVDLALRGEISDVETFLKDQPNVTTAEQERIHALARMLLWNTPASSCELGGATTPLPGGVRKDGTCNLPEELLKDYRIIRRLGAGGAGEVFLAKQRSVGRRVALKLLHPGHVGSAEAVHRFEREARAIGKLQHRNIVSVYDTGVVDGRPYIVMEFIPGLGLNEILSRERAGGGGLEKGQVERWGIELSQALSCAHEAGIVHRDVKPANIRIRPDGTALLLDFGLAREEQIETLTIPGAFRGSPIYASPEQIHAQGDLDCRTDIYSLCVTLYECVTGRTPFTGATTQQIFYEVLSREPVPPRQLNRTLSTDLETVILKGIEKEPGHRYPTANQLGEDLTAILEDRPIRARRVGPVTRAYKWSRRHRGATVAILLFWIVAFFGPVIFGVREKIAREAIQKQEIETEFQRKSAVAALKEVSKAKTLLRHQLDEVRRLSDIKLLRESILDASDLWPLLPERIPDLDRWLMEAKRLSSRIPLHQETLDRLEPLATQDPKTSEFHFEEEGDAWQHQILVELMAGLSDYDELIVDVEERRDFATAVAKSTITGEGVRATWSQAITAIKDTPAYGGLQIKPQLGLIPLGPDPDSGFWEFGHLQSGSLPTRNPETGKLDFQVESCLVFVLLPGGTFRMGATPPTAANPLGHPNVDPFARSEESPVHEVSLGPFFISKFEMTQAQWIRIANENPSAYAPGYEIEGVRRTELHPVEQTSLEDCLEMLRRLNLTLPTEAQWEYAARGGTTTIWWTGNEKESLQGATNLLDNYCKTHGGPASWNYETWLNDGYTVHAPAGTYRPNPFGLHNTIGNVAEWCLDDKMGYQSRPREGDGLREEGGTRSRIYRGGAFSDSASVVRAASRFFSLPDVRLLAVGLRPGRKIDR